MLLIAPLARTGLVVTSFICLAPSTTHIYTLSLHDALPISSAPPGAGGRPTARRHRVAAPSRPRPPCRRSQRPCRDRKSTRLNSSHPSISYAVFCLKKKIYRRRVGAFPVQDGDLLLASISLP